MLFDEGPSFRSKRLEYPEYLVLTDGYLSSREIGQSQGISVELQQFRLQHIEFLESTEDAPLLRLLWFGVVSMDLDDVAIHGSS